MGLNPGKPCELGQALRLKTAEDRMNCNASLSNAHFKRKKKKTDKQSLLQIDLSGILTSLPTNSYRVFSICRRWQYSCQPGGKAPTLMELQPSEDINQR